MKLGLKEIAIGLGVLSLMGKKKANGGVVIQKGGNQMTVDQLRELARSVGFPDPDLAAAVAMAESGGFEAAVGDAGKSFGLWQINRPSHPKYEASLLLTPWYNAQAALEISNKGANWQPWTTYRTGAYKKYMPVPAVVAALEAPELASVSTSTAQESIDAVVEDETTEVETKSGA